MAKSDRILPGFLAGHWHDRRPLTGCTVFLCPEGAVAGVEIRGQAPGGRETALLDPMKSLSRIHGLVLTGGSTFGIDACTGVVRYLEERGQGLNIGGVIIPIVAGAVLFDLAWGDPRVRPDAESGYAACLAASELWPEEGMAGAGCGSTVGKVFGIERASTGGFRGAAITLKAGATVQAFAAVNAYGDVIDPAKGSIVAGAFGPDGGFINSSKALMEAMGNEEWIPLNTTLAAVLTDALIDKRGAARLAEAASTGMARTIWPCNTPFDGDTVFVLSTCRREVPCISLGEAVSEALSGAILSAVKDSVPVSSIAGKAPS